MRLTVVAALATRDAGDVSDDCGNAGIVWQASARALVALASTKIGKPAVIFAASFVPRHVEGVR
jgi:hypothetical protein